MEGFHFVDIQENRSTQKIDTLFPNWKPGEERLLVFSPHDDDAIIGAGYAMRAALHGGARVFVVIFCTGNAGYSDVSQKNRIITTRQKETKNAYTHIGIQEEDIINLGYSDFSVAGNIGWYVANGMSGTFERVIKLIRQNNITRVLIPNAYLEHVDHTAVHQVGAYDTPQSGDPILIDWGTPQSVETVAEYSVWSDLSPEDALVNGRSSELRANRMVLIPREEEEILRGGIREYVSQGEIINDMVERRKERKTQSDHFLEVYRVFDPRPKINYAPYVQLAEKLMEEGG